jgi:hypothetical protein
MTKARSNATANAAKGDLTVGNGTNLSGVLGVGSNGDTIVADSSTSTGLSYQANFAAGKNKIINGDFGIWQRGTSITPVSGYGFGPDRFQTYSYGTSTTTISRQTFTPGTAPVSGYESQYFCRILSTNTSAAIEYRVEDVRTISQGSWTISFWAKSASTQTLTGSVNYFYGTGGSSQETLSLTMPAITTSWARYSITFTAGSYTGKTIGANSWFGLVIAGAINNNLDIWGVQLEAGSTATAFETATGTIQGELAACQRYYYRQGGASAYQTMATGWGNAASIQVKTIFPVTMRTTPTTLDSSTLIFFDQSNAGITVTGLSIVATQSSNQLGYLTVSSVSGQTQYRNYDLAANNSTSAFLGFGAEL